MKNGRQKVIEAAEQYGWSVQPREVYQGKAVGKDIDVQNGMRQFRVACRSNGAIIAAYGLRNVFGKNKAEQIISYMAQYPAN